jgi:hypothetical protein
MRNYKGDMWARLPNYTTTDIQREEGQERAAQRQARRRERQGR